MGLFNKPGDADQLAENIAYYYENPEALKAAQSNALQMTKELGDAEKVFDEYVQFLENCSEA